VLHAHRQEEGYVTTVEVVVLRKGQRPIHGMEDTVLVDGPQVFEVVLAVDVVSLSSGV
jgi:hypothetical protein